jgi:hypothetical protein
MLGGDRGHAEARPTFRSSQSNIKSAADFDGYTAACGLITDGGAVHHTTPSDIYRKAGFLFLIGSTIGRVILEARQIPVLATSFPGIIEAVGGGGTPSTTTRILPSGSMRSAMGRRRPVRAALRRGPDITRVATT